MTTTRYATTTAAVLSLLLAAAPGCGPSDAGDGPEASDIGTGSAYRPVHSSPPRSRRAGTRESRRHPRGQRSGPSGVGLAAAGNPYGGYSVDPRLTGQAKAAQFTCAFQAAINSAGAAATRAMRKIVSSRRAPTS